MGSQSVHDNGKEQKEVYDNKVDFTYSPMRRRLAGKVIKERKKERK